MESLGERSWRQYYSQEREVNRNLIDTEIKKWWDKEDPFIDDIVHRGGVLSFPHTYIRSSLIPTIRVVRSILRSDSKKVLALGVMHNTSGYDPNEEFSLDSFKYILNRSAYVLDMRKPEINDIYLPEGPLDIKRPEKIVESIQERVQQLSSNMGINTSIVLTGDLIHYGNGYGSDMKLDISEKKAMDLIEQGLELLYSKKEFIGYLQHSVKSMNDQWGPAIAACMLLDNDLTYQVISHELSDYSAVLQVDPPCLVASVLYGVYPHN